MLPQSWSIVAPSQEEAYYSEAVRSSCRPRASALGAADQDGRCMLRRNNARVVTNVVLRLQSAPVRGKSGS